MPPEVTREDLQALESRLMSAIVRSQAEVAPYLEEHLNHLTAAFVRTFDRLIATSDAARSAAQWREAFMLALREEALDTHWWNRVQCLFELDEPD